MAIILNVEYCKDIVSIVTRLLNVIQTQKAQGKCNSTIEMITTVYFATQD